MAEEQKGGDREKNEWTGRENKGNDTITHGKENEQEKNENSLRDLWDYN